MQPKESGGQIAKFPKSRQTPTTRSEAKFLHCARTQSILRTQRLGYSPKNTRHLSSSMAKQQNPPVVRVTPFKCPTRSTIVCSCVLCWER